MESATIARPRRSRSRPAPCSSNAPFPAFASNCAKRSCAPDRQRNLRTTVTQLLQLGAQRDSLPGGNEHAASAAGRRGGSGAPPATRLILRLSMILFENRFSTPDRVRGRLFRDHAPKLRQDFAACIAPAPVT